VPNHHSRFIYAGNYVTRLFTIRGSATLFVAVLALAVVASVLLASTAFVPTAAADKAYHSEHIDLVPVGNQPLRSGFVENIHANGPKIYARERYVLNGANPNRDYTVTLLAHVLDADCSDPPALALQTATFTTNRAGNGTAKALFRPEDTAGLPRDAPHGIIWQVSSGGVVHYETACSVVTLD
jgi:hypothetical protein